MKIKDIVWILLGATAIATYAALNRYEPVSVGGYKGIKYVGKFDRFTGETCVLIPVKVAAENYTIEEYRALFGSVDPCGK